MAGMRVPLIVNSTPQQAVVVSEHVGQSNQLNFRR